MTRYTHLTEHERYHIYLMNQQHCTLTEIAKAMGRSRSTISREIKRNTEGNGYRYKQAHRFAQTRHQQKPKHIKLNDELKLRLGELAAPHIQQKLALYWSPEQISGRLRMRCGELTDPLPNNSSVKLNDAKPYHSWERGLNAK